MLQEQGGTLAYKREYNYYGSLHQRTAVSNKTKSEGNICFYKTN